MASQEKTKTKTNKQNKTTTKPKQTEQGGGEPRLPAWLLAEPDKDTEIKVRLDFPAFTLSSRKVSSLKQGSSPFA